MCFTLEPDSFLVSAKILYWFKPYTCVAYNDTSLTGYRVVFLTLQSGDDHSNTENVNRRVSFEHGYSSKGNKFT